ncbi:glucosamine-6-phosphate deaminase [Paenibacillus sp. Y412MC10]|uniref:glucosamine-6-phosphate deaminase n=1 Tax=Geobacillus sp. (strain Y412MC10) TaxID=481743 RepID=UPI0011AB8D03|nr:glucosamine-6-phosphate deaminase [Paenibacillus sp. Y412MC10]
MKLIVEENETDFNRQSAVEIAKYIQTKPDARICFATGETTKGIYAELVELYKEGKVDFSRVTAFVLDEYQGASRENPASCLGRLEAQLFGPVRLPNEHIHSIDSNAADLHLVCREYENIIQSKGGIDLQILGIGTNGHIGFNEPGTSFHSITRVVAVGQETIQARANMFGSLDLVPRTGVTMGIKTIMNSANIYLFAVGASKAHMLEKALLGSIIPDIPASVLQLHPSLTVIADKEAAARLSDSQSYHPE